MVAAPVAAVASPPSPQPQSRQQIPQPGQPPVHYFHWSSVNARGRLGLSVVAINDELRKHFGAPEDRGVMVAHVEPSSVAASAGLQVGDVITDVAGKPVSDAGDVRLALANAKRNDKVAIDVVREGGALQIEATMADDPAPPSAGWSAPAGGQELDDMRRELEREMRQMMQGLPRKPGSRPLRHQGSGVDT